MTATVKPIASDQVALPNFDVESTMDFDDLQPITVPVKYKGRLFILHEALEDHARQFQNCSARSARFKDNKLAAVDAVADARSLLLSLCLTEIIYVKDSRGDSVARERPVPLVEIKTWQHKVTKPVFERCLKISDLEEAETVESINAKIKELTEKRDRLMEADKGQDADERSDPTESEPKNGTAHSDSAEN